MSSCLVLQAKDKLYIGADTSSSVFIDDKLYRLNNNTKKLFLLDNNTVLYCAGNNLISNGVSKYIASIYRRDDFSLTTLKNWLIEKYPYRNNNKTIYDVEILIATFKDRKTIVYQMSQYKNYDIVSFEVSDAGVQILSAGIKNAECMSFAENELLNKSGVRSIFRTTFNNLSCNYIGGYLDLYEISKNGAVKIFDNEKINEHGIQYVYDVFNGLSVSLNAEVLVSKLIMSENLWIENNSGTYKFDDNGFNATNGTNTIKIQPNNSGELFSIYKGSSKQVYINSDGDVEFAGSLKSASGQFAGLVSGGSINIGNGVFTVDKNGNMYASSCNISGNISSSNITSSSATFGKVTLNSNGITSPYFTIGSNGASFSGTITANDGNIGDFSISNGELSYGNFGVFGDSAQFMNISPKGKKGTVYMNSQKTCYVDSNWTFSSTSFGVNTLGWVFARNYNAYKDMSTTTIEGDCITVNGARMTDYPKTIITGESITINKDNKDEPTTVLTITGNSITADNGLNINGKTNFHDKIEFSGDAVTTGTTSGTEDCKVYKVVSGGDDDIPSAKWVKKYVEATMPNTSDFAPSGHSHTITPSKSPNPTSGSGTHNFMYNFTTSSGTNGFSYTYGYVSGSLSDERLKENIKPIEDISDKYMKLIPIQFNFYDDIRSVYKGIHYGFSAQKVAEIFNNDNLALICREHQEDEAINKYLNEDDAYVLDKDELHALHVQMIQKHQREIESLQCKIKELERRIS